MDHPQKRFGIVEESIFRLPIADILTSIELIVENFLYDERCPPHFSKLFSYLVQTFLDCSDISLIHRCIELLSHIAGYKMGVNVYSYFKKPEAMVIKLLASVSNSHVRSAIDYCRKVSRVIGPSEVLKWIVIPNVSKAPLQRGLAIMAHQILLDFPKFPFTIENFEKWVQPISSVPNVGFQLINTISSRIPKFLENNKYAQIVIASKTSSSAQSISPPETPRDSSADGLESRKHSHSTSSISMPGSNKIRVSRYKQRPFSPQTDVSTVINDSLQTISNGEWEEKCSAYNSFRRVYKFHPDMIKNELSHEFISGVVNDVPSQRSLLSTAAIGALSEFIKSMPNEIEPELGRVIPVLVGRFDKIAPAIEATLIECLSTLAIHISTKRLIPLLVENGEPQCNRSKIEVMNTIRKSLEKCTSKELPFRRNSSSLYDLISFIFLQLASQIPEVVEDSKRVSSILKNLYGNYYGTIVEKSLGEDDSKTFFVEMSG